MRAEDIQVGHNNPITGHDNAKAIGGGVMFADVEGVVFSVSYPRPGVSAVYRAQFACSHLTLKSVLAMGPVNDRVRKAVGQHTTLDAFRHALAAYTETYEFEAARYAWQTAEPRPARIQAPYRIVRTAPWQYDAVLNDPRGYVVTMGDPDRPIYSGGHIIAQATKYTRNETGTWSGWVVCQPSSNNYGDPIKNIPTMLTNLRGTADEIVKGMGK